MAAWIDFGSNFFASMLSSFMQLLMTDSWSAESRMVKLEVKPMREMSRRNILTHMEWNVDTQMSRAEGPTSFSTRSCISRAALLVNVMARMLQGAALPVPMR